MKLKIDEMQKLAGKMTCYILPPVTYGLKDNIMYTSQQGSRITDKRKRKRKREILIKTVKVK